MDDDCEIDYKDGGFEDVYGDGSSRGPVDHNKIKRQFYAKKRKA